MLNLVRYEKACISVTPYVSRQLDVYMKNLNFGKDEIMLDVGCGQGHTTLNTLLPKMKPHLKHLVAVDINTEMLEVAKNKYSHPLITYKELDFSKPVTEDIKKELLPEDCVSNGFDKIFSSYCIMRIQNQRQVARNFSFLLKPGGELIIIICPKTIDLDLGPEVAKIPKWKPYMKDLDKYISPYQNSEYPLEELCNYLEEEGLEVIECKSENVEMDIETWDQCEALIAGFDMFINRIPDRDVGKYLEDFMEVFKRKMGPKPRYEWQCNIVHAMKSVTYNERYIRNGEDS